MDQLQTRELPPDLLTTIEVRAVASFRMGEKLVQGGEVVSVPKHRAEYLRFLELVEWL